MKAGSNRDGVGTALMLMAIVCWGSSFVWIKMALATLPPAGLAACRFGIASLILLLIIMPLPKLRRQVFCRSMWGRFLAIGFVGTFLPNILQNYGMLYLDASLSGVVQGAGPIYTAILAAFFLGERFGPRKIAGSVAAFCGTCLLFLGTHGTRGGSAIGVVLIVGSSIAYAFYTVGLRISILESIHPIALLTGTAVAGTVPLLAFAGVIEPLGSFAHMSRSEASLVLVLAVVPTVVAYLCYVGALSRMEASRAAAFIFLVPVVALLLGTVYLGESLSPVELGSCAAIIGGVVVAEWERRPGA